VRENATFCIDEPDNFVALRCVSMILRQFLNAI
jgi:hypothetical protein